MRITYRWPPPEPEFTCVMEPAPPRKVLHSHVCTLTLCKVEGYSGDKDGNEIPGSRWDTGLRFWKLTTTTTYEPH